MKISKVSDLEDYKKHVLDSESNLRLLATIDASLNNKIKNQQEFYMDGYSWTAQSNSEFLVDLQYSNGSEINLRERLVCRKTKLNNRIRGCIHVFETLFAPKLDDNIYLTEQSSVLARWLAKKYPKLVGSEYLDDCSCYYKFRLALRLFPKKICHQDLTALSFENQQFNYVLSFDCFEHIPNYLLAFKEIFRTLKASGTLLFSVPFDINKKDNLIRARIKNGIVEHLVEPEYHGDPVSNKGCLSYYTFGWQLLDELREIGFSKVYLLMYWSEKYCYLGGEQFIICAEK